MAAVPNGISLLLWMLGETLLFVNPWRSGPDIHRQAPDVVNARENAKEVSFLLESSKLQSEAICSWKLVTWRVRGEGVDTSSLLAAHGILLKKVPRIMVRRVITHLGHCGNMKFNVWVWSEVDIANSAHLISQILYWIDSLMCGCSSFVL